MEVEVDGKSLLEGQDREAWAELGPTASGFENSPVTPVAGRKTEVGRCVSLCSSRFAVSTYLRST